MLHELVSELLHPDCRGDAQASVGWAEDCIAGNLCCGSTLVTALVFRQSLIIACCAAVRPDRIAQLPVVTALQDGRLQALATTANRGSAIDHVTLRISSPRWMTSGLFESHGALARTEARHRPLGYERLIGCRPVVRLAVVGCRDVEQHEQRGDELVLPNEV